MAITVKVTVKGKVEDVINDVKKLAASKDVKFNGNAQKGTFKGAGIEGNYVVDGQDITITVTDKPWYAPEDKVKKAIQDWFNGK